jgi:purine-binding chemotaxis protein CheW
MSDSPNAMPAATIQYATFFVGGALLGLDISIVQEINRNMVLTRVPHGPPCVRGVMNLRGEVVTVLDLRFLLGLPPSEPTSHSRNIIVKCDGELVGVWVDRVADILSLSSSDVLPPPSNLSGVHARYVRGVYQQPESLVMIVDPKEILQASLSGTNGLNGNRAA